LDVQTALMGNPRPCPRTGFIGKRRFDVDPERGFLPAVDPLAHLPRALAPWDELGRQLPKLLVSDRLRSALDQLPLLDAAGLRSQRQVRRAMMLLSYFAHAYVWGGSRPADRIPRGIAVPWHQLSEKLGRPPVLSYASYALDNWMRIDRDGPIALGNIALLQNFLGGIDEEWFILIHVEIEAHAAEALRAIFPAQSAAACDDVHALKLHLHAIASSLERMNRTLLRMPEHCDPYIYYNRVRPYLYGWKDQPALPEGLLYEGVEAYAGKRQKFRGETGAQSGIVPALDAALGIAHRDDPLRTYLREMRDYMPPAHRQFLETIERGPSIRRYVERHPALCEIYNTCVSGVDAFRSTHLDYAARYIHQQARRSRANPTDIGTGGTPFMRYLKKHRDESAGHKMG
jgi:indoleamine 2,3-dioxygenase